MPCPFEHCCRHSVFVKVADLKTGFESHRL